jgi:hypothetical protein
VPKDAPPKAGDTFVSMMTLVTRAWIGGVQANKAAAAKVPSKTNLRNTLGSTFDSIGSSC